MVSLMLLVAAFMFPTAQAGDSAVIGGTGYVYCSVLYPACVPVAHMAHAPVTIGGCVFLYRDCVAHVLHGGVGCP